MPSFDTEAFMKKLHRAAAARGYTMKDVATETGVSETTLSGPLGRRVRWPVNGAKKMAKCLRCGAGNEWIDGGRAPKSEPTHDDFLAGVCVALQVVTAMDCGVTWSEIVRTVGEDGILNYAAHIEPDEWELAGFRRYARAELKRNKPRKPSNV